MHLRMNVLADAGLILVLNIFPATEKKYNVTNIGMISMDVRILSHFIRLPGYKRK